ncbi:hypothetical protein NKR19_g6058 [Coniochaeta hoffmannii]|uniref:Uncharacterized protein n=1 Tax=Coniochaeta hoffmannii TaxID=91930 RepID=A0AA38RTD3_9PEZI|nr:hypothetical protein NKR19_g6058 [Coniochaeta hoffmannii]
MAAKSMLKYRLQMACVTIPRLNNPDHKPSRRQRPSSLPRRRSRHTKPKRNGLMLSRWQTQPPQQSF